MEEKTTLTKIQEFLDQFKTQKEMEDVWQILSAIRGPDNEIYDLKYHWTFHVRRALCPRMFGHGNSPPTYDGIPKKYKEETNEDYLLRLAGSIFYSNKKATTHFVKHIAAAFLAIRHGIDETQGEKNERPE